jgi:hypothetical protein
MAARCARVDTVTPDTAKPDGASQLCVYVLATSDAGTRAAMGAARSYATGLDARVVVVVPHVVSYAGSMEDAAMPASKEAADLRDAARDLGCDAEVVSVLCRSRNDVPAAILPRDALVLIGGRSGHWFPQPCQRMATRLARAGYRALFVPLRSASTLA